MPKEWMASLPESLQNSETLAKYDSSEAALQGLVNLSSMQNQMIRIPGQDAGDEARQEFLTKLTDRAPELMVRPDLSNNERMTEFWRTVGTPVDASNYNTPEGVELPDDTVTNLREMSLNAHLTDGQYQAMIKQIAEQAGSTQSEVQNQLAKAQGELKSEWGADFSHREAIAKKTHEMFFKDQGDFGTLDPRAVRSLYDVGKQLGMGASDSQFNQMPTGEVPQVTPEDAALQYAEIMNNKDHPVHDPAKPGHQAALRKITKLAALADGQAISDEQFDQGLTAFRK